MKMLSIVRFRCQKWTWWGKPPRFTRYKPLLTCDRLYDTGGAMENWGLCIFSFRWLMFDEKNGSAAEKKRMAYGMPLLSMGIA
jgi:nitrate reductase gamma subunit